MEYLIVTSNHNKYKEMKNFLTFQNPNIKCEQIPIDLPEPMEIEKVFFNSLPVTIVLIKALIAKDYLKEKPFILEDTILVIEDPKTGREEPIVDIKFRLNEIQKLQKRGKGVVWKTIIAKVSPTGFIEIYIGKINGKLTAYPKGDNGFGFDSYFIPYPEKNDKTLAELKTTTKNPINYNARTIALNKLSDNSTAPNFVYNLNNAELKEALSSVKKWQNGYSFEDFLSKYINNDISNKQDEERLRF